MLYDKYRNKTIKKAFFLGYLKRFKFVILAAVLAITAITFTFLGLVGTITDEGSCPSVIYYGDKLGYKADAMLAKVGYEYRVKGGEWSTAQPTEVGDYEVRSVANAVFGGPRYGKTFTYQIQPKLADILIDGDSVVYGENPTLKCDDIASGERIACENFIFDDKRASETGVIADKESVKILAADGSDKSGNYTINCVKSDVTITKRKLVIDVTDAQKTYDGTPLTSDSYVIGDNTTLGYDDELIVDFGDTSITDAGEIENTPTVSVSSGEMDTTELYDIEINGGLLTVDKRPITVFSHDILGNIYGDGNVFNGEVASISGTLVDGHSLSVTSFTTVKLPGSHVNEITVQVVDGESNPVNQDNYDISYDYGTIEILPRLITLTSNSATKLAYDGEALYDITFTGNENTVYGDYFTVTDYTKLLNAGNAENVLTYELKNAQNEPLNISDFYDVSYVCGTLSVGKAALTITVDGGEKTYDGNAVVPSVSHNLIGSDTITGIDYSGIFSDVQRDNEGNVISKTVSVDKDSIVIKNNGVVVTDSYDITCFSGEYTVNPIVIEVTAASDISLVYDGTAQRVNALVTDKPQGILSGHFVSDWIINNDSFVTNVSDGEVTNDLTAATISDGERDVTHNYNVTLTDGAIAVIKRDVTVKTYDDNFIYNGEARWTENAEVIGGIEHNHTFDYAGNSGNINVGEYDNAVTLVSDGVTENYDISYELGTITIAKRKIHLTTADVKFDYDGTAQSVENAWENCVTIKDRDEDSGLLDGHELELSQWNTVTNVLDSETIENKSNAWNIIGGDKNNYELAWDSVGTLSVKAREIRLVVDGYSWTYDGENHSYAEFNNGFKYASDSKEIVNGHEFKVTNVADNTVKYVGRKPNDLRFEVWSQVNETSNYIISVISYGDIIVTPKPITVTAASDTWTYDGDKHELNEVVCTQLVDGDSITAWEVIGGVTNVWDNGDNVITDGSIRITNADGDVTSSYEITLEKGTLTITPKDIEIVTDTPSKPFVYADEEISYEYFATVTKEQLVRQHYIVGYGWASGVDAGSYDNTITGWDIYNENDELMTGNYSQTSLNFGSFTIDPRKISVTYRGVVGEDSPLVYNGEKQYYRDYDVAGVDEENALLAKHRYIAYDFVGYTDAGKYTNEAKFEVERVADDSEVDLANYEIQYNYEQFEIKKRPITIIALGGEWVYDDFSHGSPNYGWTEFDEQQKIGLVPTQKVIATTKNSVTYVWEEVYNEIDTYSITLADDTTDVTENYSVNTDGEQLKINPRSVTLRSDNGGKTYDGKPLYVLDLIDVTTAERLKGLIDTQYAAIDKNKAKSVTNVCEGNVVNAFTADDVVITSGEFLDGNVLGHQLKENYTITVDEENFGVLSIDPLAIQLITQGKTWTYDGEWHSYDSLGAGFIYDGENTLQPDHEFVVQRRSEIKNAGEVLNELEITVTDARGKLTDEQVNQNYDITVTVPQESKLIIQKRKVLVVAASSAFVYDGRAHYDSGYSCLPARGGYIEGVVPGHSVEVTVSGSATNVGDLGINMPSDFKAFSDIDGEVTYNYDPEYFNGVITILPRPITLTTDDIYHIYDGSAVGNNDGDSVTASVWADFDDEQYYGFDKPFELLDGYTFTASGYVKYTDVKRGEDNEVLAYVNDSSGLVYTVKANGEEVSINNFTINRVDGKITIEPRLVMVITGSDEKEYDGTPLTNARLNQPLTVTQLLDGHSASATFDGSVTHYNENKPNNNTVDKSTLVIKSGNDDKTHNYDVSSWRFGTLTITKRAITVAPTTPAAKIYDGQPYAHNEVTVVSGALATKDIGTLTIETSGSVQVNVGTWDNIILSHDFTGADGEAVKSSYEVSYASGTLEIIKREINITTQDNFEQWIYGDKEYFENCAEGVGYVINEAENEGALSELGHYVVATKWTKPVDAGRYVNEIEFTIYGSDGQILDETALANYQINVNNAGVLIVDARPITVQSFSGTFVYDKLDHATNSITIVYTNNAQKQAFVNGDAIDEERIESNVSQAINVGRYENTIVYDSIVMVSGNRDNYDISVISGEVVILPRPIAVSTHGGSFAYDGSGHSVTTFDVEGASNDDYQYATALNAKDFYELLDDDKTHYTVSEFIEYVNVRTDETGKLIPYYNNGTTGDDCALTLSVDGDESDNYLVAWTCGEIYITRAAITLRAASDQKIYDGEPLINTGVTLVGTLLPGDVLEKAFAMRDVTNVDVGKIANKVDLEVVVIRSAGGDNVTKNYDITLEDGVLEILPRPVTLQSSGGEWTYDGEEHCADKLTDISEGENCGLISEHAGKAKIANPITLTHYTQNDIVNAFTSDNVSIDDSMNLARNYSITAVVNGVLRINKATLNITLSDAKDEYGPIKKYLSIICTSNLNFSGLAQNDGILYELSRADGVDAKEPLTEIGKYEYSIVDVIITHGGEEYAITYDGRTIAVKENYEYSLPVTATYEITKISVVVNMNSQTWVYDGQAHSDNGFTCDKKLLYGHELRAVDASYGSITNVGTEQNVATITVVDTENDDAPVGEYYDITVVAGTLEILPRPITVTINGLTAEYDGEAHGTSRNDIALSSATAADMRLNTQSASKYLQINAYTRVYGVVDGEQSHLRLSATPKKYTDVAGEGRTIYNSVDGEGNQLVLFYDDAVASNYVCKYVYGEVVITARKLVITTNSAEKVYDGISLTAPFAEGENAADHASGLVSGHTVTMDENGWANIDTVGQAANTGTAIISDGTRDVTHNYAVSYSGTLTITKRDVHITFGGKKFIYSGVANSYIVPVKSEGVVSGQAVDVKVAPSVKEIGDKVLNEVDKSQIFIYNLGGVTTQNYEISVSLSTAQEHNYGYIEVVGARLTVSIYETDTTSFNGQTYYGKFIVTSEDVNETQLSPLTVELASPLELTQEGEYEITISSVSDLRVYNDGNNVTDKYDITVKNARCVLTVNEKLTVNVKLYSYRKTYNGAAAHPCEIVAENKYDEQILRDIYGDEWKEVLASGSVMKFYYSGIMHDGTPSDLTTQPPVLAGKYSCWFDDFNVEHNGKVYRINLNKPCSFTIDPIAIAIRYRAEEQYYNGENAHSGHYTYNIEKSYSIKVLGDEMALSEVGVITLAQLNARVTGYEVYYKNELLVTVPPGGLANVAVVSDIVLDGVEESYDTAPVFTVTPRRIVIAASDITKVCDNKTFVNEHRYDISEGSLLDGHTIIVVTRVEGNGVDRKPEGYVINVVTVQILDANGDMTAYYDADSNTLTGNYEIVCRSGLLRII